MNLQKRSSHRPHTSEEHAGVPCIICLGNTVTYVTLAHTGEVRRCLRCGLLFATAPPVTDPVTFYTNACSGDESDAHIGDYHTKLLMSLDAVSFGVPPRRLLNGADREVIQIVRELFPKGGRVLDIGCGTGRFLRAMRELDYEVYGVDVARPVVDFLRREGFYIWQGPLETTPPGWADPNVCTCSFVLHHSPDPVGFLRLIRERFPKAVLVVAGYDNFSAGPLQLGSNGAGPPRVYFW